MYVLFSLTRVACVFLLIKLAKDVRISLIHTQNKAEMQI